MEATLLYALEEPTSNDDTCGSASTGASDHRSATPLSAGGGSELTPPVCSPALARPVLMRSGSDAEELLPCLLGKTNIGRGFALSPPQTPPQDLYVPQASLSPDRPLPPNDLTGSLSPVIHEAYSHTLQGLPQPLNEDGQSGKIPSCNAFDPIDAKPLAILVPKDVQTPPAENRGSEWPVIRSIVPSASVEVGHPVEQPHITAQPGYRGVNVASETTSSVSENGTIANAPSKWIRDVFKHTNIEKKNIRVLSQAFPSPDNESHAIYRILTKLHEQRPGSAPNITLTSVVPRSYNLARLPASASPTPQEIPGDDYFSCQVISTAIPSPEQPQGLGLAVPQSLHLTVVERFIPPSTAAQVNDMINSEPDHYLANRLKEITHKGGTLVFIHPTNDGARTFAREYLGELLDPVLRRTALIYDLTTSFSVAIGTTHSLDAIPAYEEMLARIEDLCRKVEIADAAHANGLTTKYSIVHDSRAYEHIPTQVWVNWWIEQEKPRIEAAVDEYFKVTDRTPNSEFGAGVPKSTLVNEVLQGLAQKAHLHELDTPIELGVFVIRKTAE